MTNDFYMKNKKKLNASESTTLLQTLKSRFEKNMVRHKGMDWSKIEVILKKSDKLWSLQAMEETGGEPDVIAFDKKTGEYLFVDCSKESPKERRSICYDSQALESRKEHKPKDSAVGMAEDMGIELLDEEQYRNLQQLGEFDIKTSSWVKTPQSIRERGGAIFCDRRYDTVFMYHNGAESYYGARGFRGFVKV